MPNQSINQTAPSLVSVRDLVVKFRNQPILKHVNLEIAAEQIITLIGPNGAGKSTLIKAILGILPANANISGQIKVLPEIKIGYMPQRLHLNYLMPLTVKRFLQLACQNAYTNWKIKNNRKTQQQLIEHTSKLLQIMALLDSPLQTISGGELQRVLLARALINQPDLLVLDEPAQGVDITGQAELYQLIRLIKQQYSCSIIMISHDLHVVMAGTDQVICLNRHICCSGTPQDISSDPEFLKLFGTPAQQAASNLAIYTHDHNHHHDLQGKILDDD